MEEMKREDTVDAVAQPTAIKPEVVTEAMKEDEMEPVVAAAPAPALAPPATVTDVADDVPDPDEDDLDDLDDLLDDFSAAKIESKAPAAPSGSSRPAPTASSTAAPTLPVGSDDDANLDDLLNDEDFAKQLQAGMADLLGEIDKSPDVQAQFESLFKEFGIVPTAGGDVAAAAAAATGATAAAHVATKPEPASKGASASANASASAAAPSSPSSTADASFQDTIRRTMERMQASGDQATAAAAADSESADDLLSEFMKQMQSGGLGGAGSEEELSKMLVGMMEELTNKEILYEPMKELNDKFPSWMEANEDKTNAEDLKRYNEQQVVVREIVARFEAPSYSDANPEDREYIVDRMQKMQAAGSPPPDLVGDIPSAQEALAAPEESCNPQ